MDDKEIKEIEKKLQESADNIKMRKFSEVWKEIEPEIVPKRKKGFVKKWDSYYSIMLLFVFDYFYYASVGFKKRCAKSLLF